MAYTVGRNFFIINARDMLVQQIEAQNKYSDIPTILAQLRSRVNYIDSGGRDPVSYGSK